MHKFYKRTLVLTILRFQPIINKNNLVSKRLDTHEFFWFGTNNSHVVWHKYKKFLIDSIAKLRLFNCIILFGDHHKSNNSLKFWQIFGPSKPPCSLYLTISSAEKRNKSVILILKKAGAALVPSTLQRCRSNRDFRAVRAEISVLSRMKSLHSLEISAGSGCSVPREKQRAEVCLRHLRFLGPCLGFCLLAGCHLFLRDAQSPF